MNESIGAGKGVGELVGELSALVEEVRAPAHRARRERVYLRYLRMLIPVYGTLLKAMLASGIRAEEREGAEQALRNLMREMGDTAPPTTR